MSAKFKLHVIPPPFRLDWSTPRRLLVKTLFNHLLQDQAPIGHFFIEIESSEKNKFGVHHILTGMSRLNASQSTLAVIKEKVGLGTFFYDFAGKLDDSKKAQAELVWAAKKNRLKTIEVEISDETARQMFQEIDAWIKHGSYKHYGGGHEKIRNAEGSGCAEFGAHFLSFALGRDAIPKAWIRSVYAPQKLTGGFKTGLAVPISKVFLFGTAWAKGATDGIHYDTPDMELASEWLDKHYPGVTIISVNAQTWKEPGKTFQKINFSSQKLGLVSDDEIKMQWQRISLR